MKEEQRVRGTLQESLPRGTRRGWCEDHDALHMFNTIFHFAPNLCPFRSFFHVTAVTGCEHSKVCLNASYICRYRWRTGAALAAFTLHAVFLLVFPGFTSSHPVFPFSQSIYSSASNICFTLKMDNVGSALVNFGPSAASLRSVFLLLLLSCVSCMS